MATRNSKITLQLINGPSKTDLMASFMTACDRNPFKVIFQIQPGQELPDGSIADSDSKYQAIITKISHEDGSGKSFCIGGKLYDDQNGRLSITLKPQFKGYTHTTSGDGWISFASV